MISFIFPWSYIRLELFSDAGPRYCNSLHISAHFAQNISFRVSIHFAQYLSPFMCSFCSIALPLSVHPAQYLYPCICTFCSKSLSMYLLNLLKITPCICSFCSKPLSMYDVCVNSAQYLSPCDRVHSAGSVVYVVSFWA